MKAILLLLVSLLSLEAQPRLRLGVGHEFSDGYFTGLGGRGWFQVADVPAGVWEIISAEIPGAGPPVRKRMFFEVQVANVGDAPWDSHNWPLAYDSTPRISLGGFVLAQVTDRAGNILVECNINERFAFDGLPWREDASQGWFTSGRRFGLSPGWFCWSDWHAMDVTFLEDGDYFLILTLDPLGFWAQWDQRIIAFRLEGYNARVVDAGGGSREPGVGGEGGD